MDIDSFIAGLLKNANLNLPVGSSLGESQTLRMKNAPKTQANHEAIVDALATIRKYKVLSYGESRYQVTNPQFDLAMAFSDIHRKYIRLREQLFGNKVATTETLADTAADLANYSIMLLEILFYLQQLESMQNEDKSEL